MIKSKLVLHLLILLIPLMIFDGCITMRNRNNTSPDDDNFFVTGNSLVDITSNDRMEMLKEYREGDKIKEIAYDTKTVAKFIYQDNTLGAWVQEYNESSKSVNLSFYLYRIDCAENKYDILETIVYNAKESKWKSEYSHSYDKSKMEDIQPLSIAETLKEKLCKY